MAKLDNNTNKVNPESTINKISKLTTKENKSVKKCLLQIPISQHRLLKKFCAINDLKVSEFILLAIKEKLER